tara:strand:- start:4054 stop:5043 length:990 start_codon:yes stop_codon:yes gene_type:complete
MKSSLILTDYSEDLDTLSLKKKSLNKLQSNMVRVKLIYAAINPADINMIEGKYLVKPTLPFALGNEAVGEIIEVGKNVTSLSIGDRVFHPFQCEKNWIGFWQSHWDIFHEDCLKVPDFIESKQAAMLSINPITAFLMLNSFVTLKKGDWVIQNCANSAVGRWIIFLAKKLGLKTVNIVRHNSQINDLKSIGADEVIVENERFSSSILQKGNIKLALNGVGGDSAKECAKSLADYGVMVTYGAMAKKPITFGNSLFIFKNLVMTGFNRTKWVSEESKEVVLSTYNDFFSLLNRGFCQIPIYKIYPLKDYQEVFNGYRNIKRQGKVLFSFD